MLKFSLLSLRSRAIVLVLLATLPVLALTLYSYFDQRNQAIHEAQEDELVAVRNLAYIQETLFNNIRQLLMTLVRTPEVRGLDHRACNLLFAELRKQSPYIASIVATNSDGQLFASAPANPQPTNYGDRSWFKKVLQTRDLVMGEMVLGRTSGKYGIILAYPILDEAGRFLGPLAVQLDLDWLISFVAKGNFPPTTAISMTDSSRKVLFRYPEPEKYLGQMWPADLVKAMAQSNEGVAEGVGLPGDPRLFAFVRLSPPWHEIWMGMGVPMDWAITPVQHVLWRNLIVLGLVALLAMAIAWYGGELLVIRPFKKLQRVTEQLAAGDLAVRSGSDVPGGELGLLARSFDQMADSLQERQAALQESEERLRLAIDAAFQVSFEWDILRNQVHRFISLDPALPSTAKQEPTTFESVCEVVHPEDRELFTANVRAALGPGDGRYKNEYRVVHPNGQIAWLHERGLVERDEQGRPTRLIGLAQDITERKLAEEALQESERKYRELVEHASSIILRTDPQGRIIFINEYGERFFGYAKDEIVGQRIVGTLIPSTETSGRDLEGMVQDIIAAPDRYVLNENENLKRDGGRVWVRWTNKAVLDKDGRLVEIMSIGIDSTARKQAEEALRQAHDELELRVQERTEELHQAVVQLQQEVTERQQAEKALRDSEQALRYLASRILTAQEEERKRVAMELHEGLAQSMTTLKLYLRCIQRHLPKREGGIKEDFDTAHNLLKEMIEDSRRISQGLTPTLLENLGLAPAIKHLLEELGKLQDITTEVDIDDLRNLFEPQTEINIFRVFQESLHNIAKHAQATQVSVTIKRQNDRVNCSIKDNGVGFDLKKISLRKSVDKGMGLAAMEERLRMIGSRFNILSQPGMGTEISFSIPINDA